MPGIPANLLSDPSVLSHIIKFLDHVSIAKLGATSKSIRASIKPAMLACFSDYTLEPDHYKHLEYFNASTENFSTETTRALYLKNQFTKRFSKNKFCICFESVEHHEPKIFINKKAAFFSAIKIGTTYQLLKTPLEHESQVVLYSDYPIHMSFVEKFNLLFASLGNGQLIKHDLEKNKTKKIKYDNEMSDIVLIRVNNPDSDSQILVLVADKQGKILILKGKYMEQRNYLDLCSIPTEISFSDEIVGILYMKNDTLSYIESSQDTSLEYEIPFKDFMLEQYGRTTLLAKKSTLLAYSAADAANTFGKKLETTSDLPLQKSLCNFYLDEELDLKSKITCLTTPKPGYSNDRFLEYCVGTISGEISMKISPKNSILNQRDSDAEDWGEAADERLNSKYYIETMHGSIYRISIDDTKTLVAVCCIKNIMSIWSIEHRIFIRKIHTSGHVFDIKFMNNLKLVAIQYRDRLEIHKTFMDTESWLTTDAEPGFIRHEDRDIYYPAQSSFDSDDGDYFSASEN
ncbi:hypothetical protein [Pelagibaculum spongiae]|uniref:Uncharacterized protein n=1 Tax=Pelagibaculum spongiae TaxID=2080658 RepID=A0A2V1GYB6_9GAMM|nr:hypothetical protein [Pelagibaculum spongiae]PVZ70643.1 hypothetical protein DC094_08685 [Pelagibaculum spongiae]